MFDDRKLTALAKQVAERLKAGNCRIVLAESCTGGLVSALLTRIPGISQYHCGSAVVYQVATKTSWLGVPRSLLKNRGPVSPEVASEMAIGALQKTPQADVAAAVTGHLGPGAAASPGWPRLSGVCQAFGEIPAAGGDGQQGGVGERARRRLEGSTTTPTPPAALGRRHLLSWILKGLEVHE